MIEEKDAICPHCKKKLTVSVWGEWGSETQVDVYAWVEERPEDGQGEDFTPGCVGEDAETPND